MVIWELIYQCTMLESAITICPEEITLLFSAKETWYFNHSRQHKEIQS